MTQITVEMPIWIVYHVAVVALIALDLWAGVRRGHALTIGEALRWVLMWIAVGVSMGLFIMYRFGGEFGATYFGAYILEYTLSVDNLFVFAIIFSYFSVPAATQPIVLYVGIISAILMRATFIYGGLLLLETFHWTVIIFGVVLLYTGFKIWKGGAEKIDISKNPVVKWTRRILPITDDYSGSKFLVRNGPKLAFTPLIIVLMAIESTDIMFAVDSVPAALALTQNFFIAYTSNISAVLGLRSLYFVIALSMFRFKYIGKGLAFILSFLGVKFLLASIDISIPTWASLAVVFGALSVAVLASTKRPRESQP